MAAAVAAHVAWIGVTTGRKKAEQARPRPGGAAGVYGAAFAATVPPPVIEASRAVNVAGRHEQSSGRTHRRSATEALRGDVGADAAAMCSYAGSSATASPVESRSTTAANGTNPSISRRRPGRRRPRPTLTSGAAVPVDQPATQHLATWRQQRPRRRRALVGHAKHHRYLGEPRWVLQHHPGWALYLAAGG